MTGENVSLEIQLQGESVQLKIPSGAEITAEVRSGGTITPQIQSTGPRGATGETGPRGVQGPPGDIGPQGETGDSGVYFGETEPTDPDKLVWIDPSGDASVPNGLPPGGNIGDILTKTTSADYAAGWTAPADRAEADNTRPITSAAVYTEIGNINALLATI